MTAKEGYCIMMSDLFERGRADGFFIHGFSVCLFAMRAWTLCAGETKMEKRRVVFRQPDHLRLGRAGLHFLDAGVDPLGISVRLSDLKKSSGEPAPCKNLFSPLDRD